MKHTKIMLLMAAMAIVGCNKEETPSPPINKARTLKGTYPDFLSHTFTDSAGEKMIPTKWGTGNYDSTGAWFTWKGKECKISITSDNTISVNSEEAPGHHRTGTEYRMQIRTETGGWVNGKIGKYRYDGGREFFQIRAQTVNSYPYGDYTDSL